MFRHRILGDVFGSLLTWLVYIWILLFLTKTLLVPKALTVAHGMRKRRHGQTKTYLGYRTAAGSVFPRTPYNQTHKNPYSSKKNKQTLKEGVVRRSLQGIFNIIESKIKSTKVPKQKLLCFSFRAVLRSSVNGSRFYSSHLLSRAHLTSKSYYETF